MDIRPIDANALALETKRWFVIPDNRKTMKDAIDHAETLDYVPRHQQWISVEDRLPERNRWVLANLVCELHYPNFEPICIAKLENNGEWLTNDCEYPHLFGGEKISHWMPLPEPPKED